MELLSRPILARMIVTLGTLDLHAHKDPRNFRSNFRGLTLLCEEQAGFTILPDVATGGNKRTRDLSPRDILVESVSHRGGKAVGDNPQSAVIGASRENHIAPVTPPVVPEFRVFEKLRRHLRAFIF